MLLKDACCRSAREVYYPSTKLDLNGPKIAPGDLLLRNGDQEGKRCAGDPSWDAEHASSGAVSDDDIDDRDEHHLGKNDGCDSVQHRNALTDGRIAIETHQGVGGSDLSEILIQSLNMAKQPMTKAALKRALAEIPPDPQVSPANSSARHLQSPPRRPPPQREVRGSRPRPTSPIMVTPRPHRADIFHYFSPQPETSEQGLPVHFAAALFRADCSVSAIAHAAPANAKHSS
jgi:hypothetical protein